MMALNEGMIEETPVVLKMLLMGLVLVDEGKEETESGKNEALNAGCAPDWLKLPLPLPQIDVDLSLAEISIFSFPRLTSISHWQLNAPKHTQDAS